jgi:hypothetical protein
VHIELPAGCVEQNVTERPMQDEPASRVAHCSPPLLLLLGSPPLEEPTLHPTAEQMSAEQASARHTTTLADTAGILHPL